MFEEQLDFDYLEPFLYHDPEKWGWFSTLAKPPRGGKAYQRSYPLHLLPDVIRNAPTDRHFYISQAEFTKPNRRLVNLKQVGVCWVDLDFYEEGQPDYKPDQIEGLMRRHCEESGLPAPSLIVFSGRGAHCKWILERPVPALALPRWNAVQRELASRFQQFGIDKGASDGSRVLRLVNTINLETGERCRVLWENLQDGFLVRHSFDQLARDVLPVEREECRKKTKAKKGAALALVGGADRVHSFSAKTLNWNRLADLRTVVRQRGWTEPPKGYQDTCLFLASCFLSWSVSPARLWQEVEQLALEFCPGWKISEARAVLSTLKARASMAEKGEYVLWGDQRVDARYRWKNETIIDLLQIEPHEQRDLLTLIGPEEYRRRERLRLEALRRSQGAEPREVYLGKVEDKRQVVRRLAEQGVSPTEIGRRLGIGRTSVYRYLGAVK